MRTVVLLRPDEDTWAEEQAASKFLPVLHSIEEVSSGDLVVGRFSLHPFYDLIEQEINARGAQLLLPYQQYEYIADMRNWYPDLSEFTPRTWFGQSPSCVPSDVPGPFFVKGITNSLKSTWSRAFAQDREDLGRVLAESQADALVGAQPSVVRQWVPLRTFFAKANGQPVTEEYRFFILDGQVLSSGFYWASQADKVKATGFVPDSSRIDSVWLAQVIARVPVRFFALDVAVTADGGLLVVELNDPGLSGLCGNDPRVLYRKLSLLTG